jgi:hypothetical protein
LRAGLVKGDKMEILQANLSASKDEKRIKREWPFIILLNVYGIVCCIIYKNSWAAIYLLILFVINMISYKRQNSPSYTKDPGDSDNFPMFIVYFILNFFILAILLNKSEWNLRTIVSIVFFLIFLYFGYCEFKRYYSLETSYRLSSPHIYIAIYVGIMLILSIFSPLFNVTTYITSEDSNFGKYFDKAGIVVIEETTVDNEIFKLMIPEKYQGKIGYNSTYNQYENSYTLNFFYLPELVIALDMKINNFGGWIGNINYYTINESINQINNPMEYDVQEDINTSRAEYNIIEMNEEKNGAYIFDAHYENESEELINIIENIKIKNLPQVKYVEPWAKVLDHIVYKITLGEILQ